VTEQPPTSSSRLQINVLSNLSANIWLASITFLAIPVIYRAMGPAHYAVVGLYLLAIQWSSFLDLGLSPALGRFAAQQNRTDGDLGRVRYLLRSFEPLTLLLGVLLVLAGLVYYGSDPTFVQTWGSPEETPVVLLTMILLTLALRITANLYRAGLTGMELQAQVSLANSVLVSLRMGIPILLALMGQLYLTEFFIVQVLVGVLESLWFRYKLLQALGSQRIPVPWLEVKQQLLLGCSIAGLGLLWIVTLQVDKVVLSSRLSLADFGRYALAVQLASAVTLMTSPIQIAVLPRLTALLAAAKKTAASELYTLCCLICSVLGIASAVAIIICGNSLLRFIADADQGLPGLYIVVAVYAYTNALVAIMALSYALQNAAGVLRWHWTGALILAVVQVPLLYTMAQHGNVLLLASVYMITMLVFILGWLHNAHSRFLTIGHWQWLQQTLLRPLLVTVPLGVICALSFSGDSGLLVKLAQGVFSFLLLFVCGLLSNRQTRTYMTEFVQRHA
jgi:O-antigen/teichoic acid export membrane protein